MAEVSGSSACTGSMGDLDARLRFKKGEDDDWTKVQDKALRKKIQNRLAKRKSRVDAKKPNGGRKQPNSEQLATSSSSEGSASPPSCAADAISVEQNETLETNFDGVIRSLRQDLAADDIEAKLRAYLSLPGLSEHHFMSLMQYSLLRAFMANATVVGIDLFLFADDASLSPWTNQNPFVSTAKASHTLTPSAVQLATPHHPYLDVLAPPSLRDNILLANLNDDEEERLCMTFHKGAFTIWGSQPWNLTGWEATQEFVNEYSWLVGDEILNNSNFWRAERGEQPLTLPPWHMAALEEIA